MPPRTILLPLLTTVCLCALLQTHAQAQTPFTYQGKLENSGSPYTGTVTLRLGLYATATGGAALRTQVLSGVAVNAGIFTATATTFVAADFPGAARYLNIEVSTDGVNYTTLTPRQEVTWAPMALHAKVAESVTGTVAASQLSGTLNPSILSTGSMTGTMTFAPASGAPFAVGSNTARVLNLNADLLDGLDSTAFLQKTGGTMTGDITLSEPAKIMFPGTATSVRQMLNLYGTQYGIGVQGDTLYQRTNNDYSWFRGGIHHNDRNNPGGGTELMRLIGPDSTLWLNPGTTSVPRGRLFFGDLNGTKPRAGIGESQASDGDDVLELYGRRIQIISNQSNPDPAITFGATTGQHMILFENSTDTYGIGVQSSTQYFRTGSNFAWYKGGSHSDFALSSGGGTTLMTLTGNGTLTARGSESGLNVVNRDNNTQEWALYSRNSGATGQFAIWNSTNGSDVAAFSPNGDLYLVGELSTTVLTVRGGADLAEPFEMTKPEEMEPGSVVVIDEDQTGQLKLSHEGYDNKVAGIISGAGGVQPGLRLHQEGVMEGDHHVALSGRVYVKADASFGKIKPGDLLTTCTTPGHAMKVNDHDKAQGAILGKAMSRLDEGTGLVLVLVTLQ